MSKDKGRNEGTPATEVLDPVQAELIALKEQNSMLLDKILAMETAKAGGSVTFINQGPDSRLPDIRIIDNDPILGPEFIARVMTSKMPAGTKTAVQVTLSGKDSKTKKEFEWSKQIITDTPIRLPEAVIKHLETPQEDEFDVAPASPVYEAYLRGDLSKAEEDCRKMGFDKVVKWRGGIKYIRYFRNYTVIREAIIRNGVAVPLGDAFRR